MFGSSESSSLPKVEETLSSSSRPLSQRETFSILSNFLTNTKGASEQGMAKNHPHAPSLDMMADAESLMTWEHLASLSRALASTKQEHELVDRIVEGTNMEDRDQVDTTESQTLQKQNDTYSTPQSHPQSQKDDESAAEHKEDEAIEHSPETPVPLETNDESNDILEADRKAAENLAQKEKKAAKKARKEAKKSAKKAKKESKKRKRTEDAEFASV